MFVLLNAAVCALNVALYASYGSPISLAAAVFSGLAAVLIAIMEAAR